MVGRAGKASLLVAVAVLVTALGASAESPRVVLTAEAGVGGFGRGGQFATVRVHVRSATEVDGVLRVVAGDEAVHAVPYEVPLPLVPDARKAVEVPILLPPGCWCRADYMGPYGEVIASASPPTVDLGGQRFVVVVGPNVLGVPLRVPPRIIVDAPGKRQDSTPPPEERTLLLPPADLPSHWAGLVPVTVLIVDDRAWNGLEAEQRSAVRRWVERGGHLVMGLSDPTLPEVKSALLTWLAQALDLRAAGDPPRVELSACGGQPLPEPVAGPFGGTLQVGGGTVSLIGLGPQDPAWGTKETREAFWAALTTREGGKGSAETSPAPELTHVGTASLRLGMAYYILIALLSCGYVLWRMFRIRRACRLGVPLESPRWVRYATAGAACTLLPMGVMGGLSWRVPETSCQEVTHLRRGTGCAEWSVDTAVRLESRWGWSGAVRFEGDNGAAGLTGPRIEHVRVAWRRGARMDDAFAGTGRPGAPMLRLLGGDRVIAWARGALTSTALDALSISHDEAGVVLHNPGALTLRRVRLIAPLVGNVVTEVPPGGEATLASSRRDAGPWIVRGEVVGTDPLWEVGDGMPAGPRVVRFERTWP